MGRFLASTVLVALLVMGVLAQVHGGNLTAASHSGAIHSAATSALSTAFRPFTICNGVPSPC